MGKEQDLISASKSGDIQHVRKILSKLRKSVSSSQLDTAADVGRNGKMKKTKSTTGLKKIAKFNINAIDEDCFTALHHAALLEKADVCRELLEVEASVDLRDKNGMTPLHLAAWAGRVEQGSLLLRFGADANAVSNNGETALMLTAQYGKTDVALLLLNHKAEVGVAESSGTTALDKACQFGHIAMVELLVKSGALSYVHQLSEEDKRDSNKKTPLHLAAKHGHMEIIRSLLSHGVDVNLETANGTSLHEAALYGRKNIVKLLVEYGIDVNRRNVYNQTALDIVQHFVKSAAANEMKEILIDSGCENVTVAKANSDYNGGGPTMLSFSEGQTIVVLEQNTDGLWKGSIGEGKDKRTGYFPNNAVTLLDKSNESVASVAALVTADGQVDPKLPSNSPEALYDYLTPKMSDMPSPPLPSTEEKDETTHQYGVLHITRQGPPAKPKPLIRDESFTGKYTFEDDSTQNAGSLKTGPYEEIDLPLATKNKNKKGLNYAEMELQASDSAVHCTSSKTVYSEVAAVPHVAGGRQFTVFDDVQPRRRSNSLSHKTRPSYENVDTFSRRAQSVSKPRPVPARQQSPSKPPRYENVDLRTNNKEVSPSPCHTEIEDGATYEVVDSSFGEHLSGPALAEDEDTYEVMERALGERSPCPTVAEDEETYEVMDRALGDHSPCPAVADDVDTYEMMDRAFGGHSPGEDSEPEYLAMNLSDSQLQAQRQSPAKSPSPRPVSPYEVMTLHKDSKLSVALSEDAVTQVTPLEIRPSSSSSPLEGDIPTEPLPIVDWLTLYNLECYAGAFVAAGYDDSSYLAEITDKDLVSLGIQNPGLREKTLKFAAITVASLPDIFPSRKPGSVSEWFRALGMSIYESVFIKQGYDDIDFVVDITEEELKAMGITQQGHLRKLMVAIAKLSETSEEPRISPELGKESRSSAGDRDNSALPSEGVTSLQRVGETPPQKVAPPKPKRPVRGWDSSLVTSGRVEEKGSNLSREISAQTPITCGEEDHSTSSQQDCCGAPSQMEELQQSNTNKQSGVRRSALPPVPPRRDDSLTRSVVEDAAGWRTEQPTKHEPPLKPTYTVDSGTGLLPPPPPEVAECYSDDDSDSEPLPPPPPAEMLTDSIISTPSKPGPPLPPPKPGVRSKPPVTTKPSSNKPTVLKPAPALIPKPAPPVAPKGSSPEPTRIVPPPVAPKRLSPEPGRVAPPPVAPKRLSPEPSKVAPPPVAPNRPSPDRIRAAPPPVAPKRSSPEPTRVAPPSVAPKRSSPEPTRIAPPPVAPKRSSPEPTRVAPPPVAPKRSSPEPTRVALPPVAPKRSSPEPTRVVHPPVAPKRFSPEPARAAPPILPEAAAKRKPSPIDIEPSTENHMETDMSLEDAIRNVLRSPAPHRRLKSPGTSSPQVTRHNFDDYPLHQERNTSEQLMDDIDEMLKDLNKELDELIPGM